MSERLSVYVAQLTVDAPDLVEIIVSGRERDRIAMHRARSHVAGKVRDLYPQAD
jgi:hypothetical protein